MIDPRALAGDAAALVQVPSATGDERAVLERLAALAAGLGLHADLHEHDLAALRAHPDHPGEEAARNELWGLTVTVPARDPAAPAGWRLRPRRRRARGDGAMAPRPVVGRHRGRLAPRPRRVDMKGAVVAALHALAALRAAGAARRGRALCVASEEDGASARSPRSSATPPTTPA